MTLRKIIIAPDPRLKVKSQPVTLVDDAMRALMDDMLETMYDAPGIGLAAIQIGEAKRVIVLDLGKDVQEGDDGDLDEKREPRYFINPEITWTSDDVHLYEEGCLSLPSYYEDVERPAEVKVSYLDYNGDAQELHCKDMLAVCIQHEMDHLEGVLFVDHLTRLKRQMILRKLTKAKKQMALESA